MNFFILYVALPALFYRILAQTPLEKIAQIDFIFATTLGTFWAFALSFAIGMATRHGNIAEAAIAGARARAGDARAGAADLLLRQQYPVYNGAVSVGACQAATGEHRHDRARRGQAHRLASADHRECARRRLGGAAFSAAGGTRLADAVSAERGGALRAVSRSA
jgi:hypothetical protein